MPTTTSTRTARPRRNPIKRRHPNPSMTSLLSGITQLSTSSSGSNSTVTPESMVRARQRSAKQINSKKASVKKVERRRDTDDESSPSPIEGRLDVFAFMEEEEDEENRHNQKDEITLLNMDTSAQASRREDPKPQVSQAEMSRDSSIPYPHPSESYYQTWIQQPTTKIPSTSLHSDSGISVRSSSPDIDSPILRYKALEPSEQGFSPPASRNVLACEFQSPMVPKPNVNSLRQTSRSKGREQSSSIQRYVPEPTSHPYPYSIPQYEPEASYQTYFSNPNANLYQHGMHALNTPQGNPQTKGKIAKTGFDLLASSISTQSTEETTLRPIYRKFETIQNRLLLELQAEILKMEKDLERLDSNLATSSFSSPNGSKIEQTSDVEQNQVPTVLHWHRTELLRGLAGRVETYNRTLSSYASLTRQMHAPSATALDRYRSFVTDHNVIDQGEAAWIGHSEDLFTVSNESTKPADRGPAITAAIILCLIVAFKLIPSILSRVVIGIVVGAAVGMSGQTTLPLPLYSSKGDFGLGKTLAV
ncbi:hypothetical protein MMC09_002439 [Bachmanniomyces sp. S44760]|nr:hypothetical protein [Bachmanniomyces sp. S44760]